MKKWTKAQDRAYDKKHGIKEGSKKDEAIDKAHGVKDRKLSYQARKKLPKKAFALPGKRNKGKGGYPIPDKAHARNALARVSAFGTPAEKATVRAKVHAKFPGIGKKRSAKRSAPTPAGSKNPFSNLKTDRYAGTQMYPNMLSKTSKQGTRDTGKSLLQKAMKRVARKGR